jgi:tetratricopeptide (TPR) repeat protein
LSNFIKVASAGFRFEGEMIVDRHLTLAILMAKHRGELHAEQNEDIRQHLAACEHCQHRDEIVPHIAKLLGARMDRHLPSDKTENCFDHLSICLYVAGQLPFFKIRKIETHLANCENCRRVLVAFSQIDLSQLSVEEKALLESLPPIQPAERLAQVYARLNQLGTESVHPRKYSAPLREIGESVFYFRPKFRHAFGIVVMIIGLLFVWQKAPGWYSDSLAQRGMKLLVQQQFLSSSDLRPAGNFKHTNFPRRSQRRGHSEQQESPIEASFRKSLNWNPENRLARHGLALSAYFDGNDMQADSLLRLLLAEDPQDACVLNDLGVVAQRRGKIGSAIAFLEKALRVQPNFTEAVFNYARILEESGRSDEARRAWQKYVKIDSTSEWAEVARNRLPDKSVP